MRPLTSPDACRSMADLRQEIDTIDAELVRLLAVRATYIDRAVDLKKIENLPARTTDRVKEVLEKVSGLAEGEGLDPGLVRRLWTELIEWSIRREERRLGPGDP